MIIEALSWFPTPFSWASANKTIMTMQMNNIINQILPSSTLNVAKLVIFYELLLEL